MSVRSLLSVVFSMVLIVAPVAGHAQGFAGLGSTAEGFAIPERGTKLEFPKDHGPHSQFKIEWWYVTANLVADTGETFGIQWTLFRSAVAPGDREGWADPQIWIGHAAVTSRQHHYVAERLGRGGVGQAGVVAEGFHAWIDDWEMKAIGTLPGDQLDDIALSANGDRFSYRLELDAKGPLVLQGDGGYSVKSASGQASYYYSQPFYQVSGTLNLDGKPITVKGKAWLDREWSSQPLAADQKGWDWFSLHMATGEKLMAFRLRDGSGGFNSANWISADGTTKPLSQDEILFEPLRTALVNGKDIPVAWRIRVPGKGFDITTTALNEQSWMSVSTPYWEGPISFEGSMSGTGYLEMTGY
jgi:predicted secreted hydrolase